MPESDRHPENEEHTVSTSTAVIEVEPTDCSLYPHAETLCSVPLGCPAGCGWAGGRAKTGSPVERATTIHDLGCTDCSDEQTQAISSHYAFLGNAVERGLRSGRIIVCGPVANIGRITYALEVASRGYAAPSIDWTISDHGWTAVITRPQS